MTYTSNIDRRAKPSLAVTWTGRLAPAFAGSLMERFLTNDSATSIGSWFGITAADVRSAFLFAAIVALTEPRQTFRLIGVMIYKIRVFCHDALGYIKDGLNKPIGKENEKNP
jgi:hypothetical protein